MKSHGNRLRTATAAMAGLLSIALALSGCSVGGTSSSSTTSTGGTKPLSTLNVAMAGKVDNLYPPVEGGILNYYIASLTAEGLTALDNRGKTVPAVAASWRATDAKTYAFTLRRGVKFQDGTLVTPKDVVASIEAAKDPKVSPSSATNLSAVTDVTAVGDEGVQVKLASPQADFPGRLSSANALWIMPATFWKSHGTKIGTSSSLLEGTGPYKIVKFVPGSYIQLENAGTWWGPKPTTESVKISFIDDENARLLAARSGDVDMAFDLPFAQIPSWQALGNFQIQYQNNLSYVGLMFDTKVAPFDDVNVRKAIAQSFDYNGVVTKLLRGHATVATGIPTPDSFSSAYSPKESAALLASLPQYHFDLTAAKTALAASKYPKGFKAEILYPNTGPQLGEAAQSLAANLKEIGITLTVKEVPISQWLSSLGDGTHGISFMWYFSTTGDPAEVTSFVVGKDTATHFSNPTIDTLLTDQAANTDPKSRIDQVLKINRISAEQAVNVPLWWGQSATAYSNRISVPAGFDSFTLTRPWAASFTGK